jgi:hypothetical protein
MRIYADAGGYRDGRWHSATVVITAGAANAVGNAYSEVGERDVQAMYRLAEQNAEEAAKLAGET